MIFVDWLKLFELPSAVAYVALSIAAVYCVGKFIQDGDETATKMIAVAELLLFAQAILMLQGKTQRLFEQLLVFALLDCVVAAIFNDAFDYAIWMIPLTVAMGVALAHLAADHTVEEVNRNASRDRQSPRMPGITSLTQAGLRMPWMASLVIFPAIALLAAFFFFGLPRRAEARRSSRPGTTSVGFSDQLRLGQIGSMLQNTQRILRVSLADADTGKTYTVDEGLYLRGRVLEKYFDATDRPSGFATWGSVVKGDQRLIGRVPMQYRSGRETDENFFDRVKVDVKCEPLSSDALFAIAPFHWMPGSQAASYLRGRWTLQRSESSANLLLQRYGRLEYSFGTTGFHRGRQREWTRFESETALSDDGGAATSMTADDLDYLDAILDYPQLRIPSARRIADKIVKEQPPRRRGSVDIARALESHLNQNPAYQYTLDLTRAVNMDLDPIEQFLRIDRRGHCQFFASALVMMLRSQEIPARIVVGYHTDEYSKLGRYFLARQSHAHAWVEALIPADELPGERRIYGQRPSSHYWLRLDPTPGGGGDQGTSATQVFDMAQNLWDDYVVEMDTERQQNALLNTPGLSPMTQSYRSWIDRIKATAVRINAGEVSGIGGGPLFSPIAAFGAIMLTSIGLILLRLRLPLWWRRRFGHTATTRAARPSIEFYAEAMAILQSIAPERKPGQTAADYVTQFIQRGDGQGVSGPLQVLTDAFYRIRYGHAPAATATQPEVSSALNEMRQRLATADGLPQSTSPPLTDASASPKHSSQAAENA